MPDSVNPPSTEETTKGSMKEQTVTLEIPFPDTFVYSNCSAFSASLMDFRISFAEMGPNGVQVRVGVTMAPEHAAVLVMNLQKQIEAYERTFGPLRHPEWIATQIKAKAKLAEARPAEARLAEAKLAEQAEKTRTP